MRRPELLIALLTGCTFTSPSTDPGLPGVSGTSAAGARAPFVRMMMGVVRGELASWEAALRGSDARPLAAHYAQDASVVQPTGEIVKGEAVAVLADSLRAWANDGSLSQLDIEVSDGIGYVYGAYDLSPRRAGTAGSRGRHITVFRQREDDWHVRLQMFGPSAPSAFRGIAGNVEPGALDLGTTQTGSTPTAAYRDVLSLTAELTRLWNEGDVRGLRRLFEGNALVQLPEDEIAARGPAVEGALERARTQLPDLQTVILDFTASGRLAAVIGRYVTESGSDHASGPWMMVFIRNGNDWRIRALLVG